MGQLWKEEKVYVNSNSFLDDLLADIESAKQSIDIETYILGLDEVGDQVTKSLKEASERGVKVRLLVDGFGSSTWLAAREREIASSKIELRIFRPFPWPLSRFSFASFLRLPLALFFIKYLNSRNHRKLYIIDKDTVYTGSLNLLSSVKDWYEMGLRLRGGAPAEIQASFEVMWLRSVTSHSFRVWTKSRKFRKQFRDSEYVETNLSASDRRRRNRIFCRKIETCRDKVWLINPYFVPPLELTRVLEDAAGRGVDVRIILAQRSDVPLIRQVSQLYYDRLLQSGVKIFEYLCKVLHAKVVIIDDDVVIGSSNLNHRSFFHDFEIDIHLANEESKQFVLSQFQKDIENSEPIALEKVRKWGFFWRLFTRFLLLFKNWL